MSCESYISAFLSFCLSLLTNLSMAALNAHSTWSANNATRGRQILCGNLKIREVMGFMLSCGAGRDQCKWCMDCPWNLPTVVPWSWWWGWRSRGWDNDDDDDVKEDEIIIMTMEIAWLRKWWWRWWWQWVEMVIYGSPLELAHCCRPSFNQTHPLPAILPILNFSLSLP